MQPPQNNLVQEIILGIVAGIIAITAPVLLYLGTINFSGALAVWAIAAGVVGFKLALNAPSPTQQAQTGAQQGQLNAQQASLQQLVQYALTLLPGIVQSLQAQAPVASPQVQQTAVTPAVQPSVPTPDVAPVANPTTVGNPTGTATTSTLTPPPQFRQPTPPRIIPDVSAPYPVAGQGIPLGQ